jgi:hypothetical protein
VAFVQPDHGCTILMTEVLDIPPDGANWRVIPGLMSPMQIARFRAKYRELQSTDWLVDWSEEQMRDRRQVLWP